MCGASPGDLGGPGSRIRPKIQRKPGQKSPARLPSGTQLISRALDVLTGSARRAGRRWSTGGAPRPLVQDVAGEAAGVEQARGCGSPLKGPRGPFKGPRGPLQGPRCPFKGPLGPLKGPRGPFKGLKNH